MVPDLQVWIDSQVSAGHTIVIPYVKSEIDRYLHYRVDVVKQGAGGSSRISQGGTVRAPGARPVPLGRTSIAVQPHDVCKLEVVLTEKGAAIGIYRFDCPR